MHGATRTRPEGVMLTNRSMPRATVIPELGYADVTEAAAWLCRAFGFSVRLRIGNHRISGGHVLTFSESIADVDRRDWGGEPAADSAG